MIAFNYHLFQMFSKAALPTYASFPIKFFQSIASNPHPHILFKNYTSKFKQKIFAYLFQQNIEEKHYCFLRRVLKGWNTRENKTFYSKTPSWSQDFSMDGIWGTCLETCSVLDILLSIQNKLTVWKLFLYTPYSLNFTHSACKMVQNKTLLLKNTIKPN